MSPPAGPVIHAQHHRLGHTGYAPYFRWCDALYERMTGKSDQLRSERTKDTVRIKRLLDKSRVNQGR